jgi:hypothetical protein
MLGSSLRIGSTLLITGLILFSFGLLIALHQTIIVKDIMSVIPDIIMVEVVGVLLQAFGAVFIVNGLLMSISSLVEVKLKDERHVLIGLTARMERTLNTLESKIAKITKASETVQKCKYCGTEFAEGNIFCPACGKSQK